MNIAEKIEVIKRSQFFIGFSMDILEKLASLTTEHSFDPMVKVINEGELGDSMYFIVQGRLKVHNGDKVRAELKEFDVFGELAMLSSEVRLASVTAVDSSFLLQITRKNIYAVMSENRDFYEKVIDILCRRTRQIIELEKKLNQSEKLASLGLLTSGIAHELRNPLNFIMNFSSLAESLVANLNSSVQKKNSEIELTKELDEIGSILKKIQNHSRRADSIVNGLLSTVHLSDAQFEKIVIPQLIREAIPLTLNSFKSKYPDFEVLIEEKYDEVQLNVIPKDLIRVFINIMDNAFYAMNERKRQNTQFKPELKIRCQENSEGVVVKFKDNGGGLSQIHLDQIFQPFFTTKPVGAGTGLGLSICYDIITKQHKGKLIANTDNREYTEIIISLPKTALL